MTKKIEVGDRVQCILPMEARAVLDPPYGATGTVVGIYSRSDGIIHVQWDALPFRGHNCFGLCPNGTGWNMSEKHLEVIVEAPEESFSCAELL